MANFLHRTSSFQVYEIILKAHDYNIDKISKEMLKLGHKRTLSDIREMVSS